MSEPDAGLRGRIEGFVSDENNLPVSGAWVAAISEGLAGDRTNAAALVQTGDNGGFCLNGLKSGAYHVTVTAPRLVAASRSHILVHPRSMTRCNLVMDKIAEVVTLTGTVRLRSGELVPGAEVRAIPSNDDDSLIFFGVTNDSGTFELCLPQGTYSLVAATERLESIRPQRARENAVDLVIEERPPRREAPSEVMAWLRTHARPISTVEAGHGFDDLSPLGEMIGDASVVCLGEATHGTREFFQLKHRLLEYLVAEHGFTVFAIEANWPESLAVDEYVMTGVGDPAAALAGMRFWTWDTEEVLEMIRWMRAWNEDPSHQQKVRFFGFDMQSPQVAAEAIVSYYEQIDPRFAECARRLLEAFGRGFTHTEHFKRSAADLDAIGKGLDSIAIRLATTRDLPDASTWNRVRHHLRIITQCHDLARSGDQDRAHIRDRSMAENLVWLMDTEAPGAKVVAWAHNGHVRKSEPSEPARTMGGFLADIFGARVVTVGLLFGEGSFQAIERAGERPSRGLREFTVPLPPPDSWDATLAAIGLPILALDLRRIPQGGSVAEWLSLPHSSRSIGSVFSDETASRMLTPLDAPRAFDIVLFIAKTTAARPNVKKPPRKPLPVAAPHPVNLDLRAGLVGEAPPGWQLSEKTRGVGHRVIVEGSGTGRRSLLIQSTTNDPANFANVLQRIDATPYRGMRIRFRADVRTEGDGHAQLWVRVDRENGDRGFFDNMGLTPIKTDVWREHAIEGEVDADAAVLNFGLVVVGEARAWFSHIALLCGPEITRTRVPADNGR